MLGRLRGLEELAVNSDDVDRRASVPLCGKRLVELPDSWSYLKRARSMLAREANARSASGAAP
jgi:hypothetical protein